MLPALPREVAIGIVLVVCQLIYSQIYPYLGFDALFAAESGSFPALASGIDLNLASPSPARKQEEAELKAAPTEPGPQEQAEPPDSQEAEHFASSKEVRRRLASRSAQKPKYFIGDIVRDRVLFTRGAVIGWDFGCKAPDWWRRTRLAFPEWASMPHYLVAADVRDVVNTNYSVNLTFYAPEGTLERLQEGLSPVISPVLTDFFHLYDTSFERYVPTKELVDRYPDDVHKHYRKASTDKDALPDADPRGKPLLRVLELGRMIAHGSPLPVVRRGMFLVAADGFQGDFFQRTVILLLRHDDEAGTLGVIVNKNFTANERKSAIEAARAQGKAVEQQIEELRQRKDTSKKKKEAQEAAEALKGLAPVARKGECLLKLARTPGVEIRIGGPVGLQEFPFGPHHVVMHPFSDIKGRASALAGSGSSRDPDLYFNLVGDMRNEDILEVAQRVRDMEYGKVIIFQGNSGWGPKQLAGEIRGSLHGASSWNWISATSEEVISLPVGEHSAKRSSRKRKAEEKKRSKSRKEQAAPPNEKDRGDEFWKRLSASDALEKLSAP